MKKKNGFTLVELMATIAILVLMSLVIGTNIVSILRATEDNEETFITNNLEKAACVYADSTTYQQKNNKTCESGCKIKVEDLIEAGLIDDSYEEIKDKEVTVKYEDGEKICTYK